MQRTSPRTISNLAAVWRHTFSSATKLARTILCGLLLVSSSLAQEQRPEPPPEPPTPEASTTQKPPDPNETLTPNPQANQSVDGDIVFTSPGQFTYPRDIRLSDNFGGLRFYGANSLTTQPAGAAIQFFGNNASPFNGQLYLDSGANNSAALIFRTAQTAARSRSGCGSRPMATSASGRRTRYALCRSAPAPTPHLPSSHRTALPMRASSASAITRAGSCTLRGSARAVVGRSISGRPAS